MLGSMLRIRGPLASVVTAVMVLLGSALPAQAAVPADARQQQTAVTQHLNRLLNPKSSGIFVRAPDKFSGAPQRLVPATLLRNDILTPTGVFPAADPICPTPDGSNGYGVQANLAGGCAANGYVMAQAGIVVGTHMDRYDVGVYYPTDSNSVDNRCHDLGNGTVECAEGGVGIQTKGPVAYDGTGCHAEDQADSPSPKGVSLVSGANCRCNAALSGNRWNDWVDHWLKYSHRSTGATFPWFQGSNPKRPYYVKGGARGKAPMWALDQVSCSMTTKKDAIELQNALWQRRLEWWNGTLPTARFGLQQQGIDVSARPATLGSRVADRYYFGWNEIPVRGAIDAEPGRWDALMIKLPAQADSLTDLSPAAARDLDALLVELIETTGVPIGSPAGKPAVVLTETYSRAKKGWQHAFGCETFDFRSVGGSLTLTYVPPGTGGTGAAGACVLSRDA